jgi:hypothetical protein
MRREPARPAIGYPRLALPSSTVSTAAAFVGSQASSVTSVTAAPASRFFASMAAQTAAGPPPITTMFRAMLVAGGFGCVRSCVLSSSTASENWVLAYRALPLGGGGIATIATTCNRSRDIATTAEQDHSDAEPVSRALSGDAARRRNYV